MFTLAVALQLAVAATQPQTLQTDTAFALFEAAAHVVVPGSAEEDRARGLALSAPNGPVHSLLRSPRLVVDGPGTLSADGVWLIVPRARASWNSELPFGMNEGGHGAGKGSSIEVLTGFAAKVGRVSVALLPRITYLENTDFQTFASPVFGPNRPRHELASPFHDPPESLDLPQRPGFAAASDWNLGESRIDVGVGPISLGATSETMWWGPGARNGILMSSNAQGFPHLNLRTNQPLETGAGAVEARWVLGRLEESPYFDFDETNDFRSISALAVTLSPAFDPDLTVGFARAVYAPAEDSGLPIGAAFDVLRNVGRPASADGDSLTAPGPDQLFTIFGRWRFPASGMEAYAEWGRYEQPRNLRHLLTMPSHSQGYTVGAQWARDAFAGRFRLQSEVTYLEPSTSYRVRPVHDWYTSRSVPQGYTHLGRVIGAGIGPGGSSQWLAADYLQSRWHAGTFAGRIRWENQAQFTYPAEYRFADVTLFGGLRAGFDAGYIRADVQLSTGFRYNYLFQAQPLSPGHHRGVDIRNTSVSLTLSAGGPDVSGLLGGTSAP